MSIGSTVRRAFGPYEKQVAEIYRRAFVDLDDLSRQIGNWVNPRSILEIGCGEGALAGRLARDFPQAKYLGIDIIPHVGRLYDHPSNAVSFRQVTVQELVKEAKGKFDLIVFSDVLHHLPQDLRLEVLTSAKELLSEGGFVVLKDWKRQATPIHAAVYFADVYIGGDRNVHFMSLDEQRAMIKLVFGDGMIQQEANIAPWNNNHAFLIANRGD